MDEKDGVSDRETVAVTDTGLSRFRVLFSYSPSTG